MISRLTAGTIRNFRRYTEICSIYNSNMERITRTRSAENSEETKNAVCNAESKSKLQKFKAEPRPKLGRGSKRPHITPAFEEIAEATVLLKEEPIEIQHSSSEELELCEIKMIQEIGDDSTSTSIDTVVVSPKKKPKVAVSKTQVNNDKSNKQGPANWEEMLRNVEQMREAMNAPVDTMGCDRCQDETANPKDRRYQVLLSLMLSSQTKDQVTFAAMQRLIEHGCSVDKVLEMSDEKLGTLIYPVGFWKTKVKYIKESTRMIKEEYDGDIPNTAKELCKLKGVGPKMAHLCMKTAWEEITGIGVDTHVHRITNRMGWVKSKTPEDTRKQLEDWLPQNLWSKVNHLLVGFGQQICQPIKPLCATCLNKHLCPYGIETTKPK